MDYANGKIYKITGGGMTYYGSTTQALSKRMYCHKQLKYSSKIIVETGEAIIVLVELFPCTSKEELFSRERWFIENNECVNKNIPMRTDKEYRIDNANKISERMKKYNIKNADKIKQNYIDTYDVIKERQTQYAIDNADKIKEYKKQYNKKNADKIKEKCKQYYIDNKDKIDERAKQYAIKKKEQNNNL